MAPLRNGSALFVLFAVLRCALLAVAWACVGVFLFWCVVFNLPHWSWAYQEGDFWEEMRQKVTLRWVLQSLTFPTLSVTSSIAWLVLACTYSLALPIYSL